MDSTKVKPQYTTTKVRNQKFFEYMIYTLIIIGVILAAIGNYFQKNNNKEALHKGLLQTSIAGYMVSAIGLLILLPFSIKFNTIKANPNSSIISKISTALYRIVGYPLPTILTIAVLGLAVAQLMKFQDRLLSHHVANEYYTWSNTFSFLLLIQMSILLNYLINGKDDPNGPMRYMIYLLTVFNSILLGITYIILQYFSTDG
tara:strand:+ start:1173 stop:1778 length:606 start_codon:yes stop_codon:yes gene_type:complete